MSLREQKKLAAWRTIRDSALALYERQGFESTTVEQIAEAANVSRATFFNYFAGKEAVLFDEDPEVRDQWRVLLEARARGASLWEVLTDVMISVNESMRDRMPLQRRLKGESPNLVQASQAFGEQLSRDLSDWLRSTEDRNDLLDAMLVLNLALAASATAYQSWEADETFDDYLQRLRHCLDRAGRGPVNVLR